MYRFLPSLGIVCAVLADLLVFEHIELFEHGSEQCGQVNLVQRTSQVIDTLILSISHQQVEIDVNVVSILSNVFFILEINFLQIEHRIRVWHLWRRRKKLLRLLRETHVELIRVFQLSKLIHYWLHGLSIEIKVVVVGLELWHLQGRSSHSWSTFQSRSIHDEYLFEKLSNVSGIDGACALKLIQDVQYLIHHGVRKE